MDSSSTPTRSSIKREQNNDPDRAPKGAKGSKELEHKTGSKTGQKQDGENTNRNAYLDMKEVGRHNLSNDAWVVIDGKVWE